MITSTLKKIAAGALIALGLGTAAQAAPMTWFFKDVVLSDGGSVTGSFMFDADPSLHPSKRFTNYNITTTAGAAYAGASYKVQNWRSVGGATLITAVTQDYPWTDTTAFWAELEGPLTAAGGELAIKTNGYTFEGMCRNEICDRQYAVRRFVSGSVTTTSPVPLPASALLLLSGMVGLGLLRMRRRAAA